MDTIASEILSWPSETSIIIGNMAKHLRYPAGKLCPMCYQLNDAAVGTQPRGESAENGRKHGAVELWSYGVSLSLWSPDRQRDRQTKNRKTFKYLRRTKTSGAVDAKLMGSWAELSSLCACFCVCDRGPQAPLLFIDTARTCTDMCKRRDRCRDSQRIIYQ